MKLLFPNGEHDAVEIGGGDVLVGAGAECAVMLAAPGIGPQHCKLFARDGQTFVQPFGNAVTVLNGKQIAAETPIKPGDLLLFARVGARVVAVEKTPAATVPRRPLPSGDEDGRTRVRMALPKFVMRGVSGPTFGKTFGVVGTLILGRSAECDIAIPSDEISRHHAKLQVVPDGVMVEDMGSANGTFVNGVLVRDAVLHTDDQIAFDRNRFLLEAPSLPTRSDLASAPAAAQQVNVTQTMRAIDKPAAPPVPPVEEGNRNDIWWLIGAAALIATGIAVLLYISL